MKTIEPLSETIKFEFTLFSEFNLSPPVVEILVDDERKFYGPIEFNEISILVEHTCNFNIPHKLTLIRSGSTSADRTQMLSIKKLKIDGIDIKNIIYNRSYTIPIYPEPWATEQKNAGINLPKEIKGTTDFGHDCTWYLNFTSPFYRYIMGWMGGGLHD